MTAERKIFISAAIYGILGLVAGFFGRTYTHSMGMEDSNHLSVLHTHILTLGFFFFLITLVLEKVYALSSQKKLFSAFFGHTQLALRRPLHLCLPLVSFRQMAARKVKLWWVFLASDTF